MIRHMGSEGSMAARRAGKMSRMKNLKRLRRLARGRAASLLDTPETTAEKQARAGKAKARLADAERRKAARKSQER
jgi:hypothetical protein